MLWDVKTRSSIVPSQDSGNNTQGTTNLGGNVTSSQMSQVTGSQEQEGQGQEKEHGGQGNVGAKGGDPKNEGENTPRDQKDSKGVIQSMNVNTSLEVTGNDTESGNQDGSIRQPEGTIGAIEKAKLGYVKKTRLFFDWVEIALR